jgi:hypothetical protein
VISGNGNFHTQPGFYLAVGNDGGFNHAGNGQYGSLRRIDNSGELINAKHPQVAG